MPKRFIGFTLAIVLSSVAMAQLETTAAPPPIAFGDWTRAVSNEEVTEFHTSFPSALTTQYEENNTVPVVAFLPTTRDKPIPAVLVLHYLGAGDLKVERSLGMELAKRGIGAVLITLPYHIDRTPKGKRSGELAISSNPDDIISTVVQCIWDVRRTVDFMESRPEFDSNNIGISGTSLGSIVAALAYAVEPRIKRSAFVLGGVDIAHILWHSSLVVKQRESFRGNDLTESKLRERLASIEPLNFLSSRQQADAYVIGAKFDTVIPPADTQKLIDATPGSKSLWLDTGHYGGIFVQKRVQRSVADFFEARSAGREFSPPKKIYAPTLRLGVLGTSNSGFQVGAGIDLFKFDSRGQFLSTLFATPKGLELFIGARIDKNVFIGGFGSQRGVGFGASWSTVL